MNIHGLHHSAYRCRDSEETRAFYEDFLGLPLAEALKITGDENSKDGDVLHTFFRMEDGSFLAFFEAPKIPFNFKRQNDFDLHIALEASVEFTNKLLKKASAENREVRGPIDHGVGISTYFRDPNGYVVELVNKTRKHDELLDPKKNNAQNKLQKWQNEKIIEL
ncbi:MAG: VOC family protein [Zetaproteobacteria bacterium]|nr:VOC family protein [Zetaproteobacteria bacterium]